MRGLIGRSAGGLVDQGILSLASLLVSVAVARDAGVEAFGAFALTLQLFLLIQALLRGVVADCLVIRLPTLDRREQNGLLRDAMAAGLVVALPVAGILTAIGWLMSGELAAWLRILGPWLPALAVQDVVRHHAIGVGRPSLAVALSLIWGGVAAVASLRLLITGWGSALGVFGWWVAGGVVAGAVGGVLTSCAPAGVRGVRRWFVAHRRLVPGLVGENLALTATAPITTFMLGGSTGLASVAAVRGVRLLFNPLSVLNVAVRSVAVAELNRAETLAGGRARRVERGLYLLLGAAPLAWYGVLLVLPDEWAVRLLGDVWTVAVPLAGVEATGRAATGVIVAAGAVLRARWRTTDAFRLRLGTMAALVCGALGAIVLDGGAWGVVSAQTGVALVAAALWTRCARIGSPVGDHRGELEEGTAASGVGPRAGCGGPTARRDMSEVADA